MSKHMRSALKLIAVVVEQTVQRDFALTHTEVMAESRNRSRDMLATWG